MTTRTPRVLADGTTPIRRGRAPRHEAHYWHRFRPQRPVPDGEPGRHVGHTGHPGWRRAGAAVLSVLALAGGCAAMTGGALRASAGLAAQYHAKQDAVVRDVTEKVAIDGGLTYRIRKAAEASAIAGLFGGPRTAAPGSVFVVVTLTVANTESAVKTFLPNRATLTTTTGGSLRPQAVEPSAGTSYIVGSLEVPPGSAADGTLVYEVAVRDVAGARITIGSAWGGRPVELPLNL